MTSEEPDFKKILETRKGIITLPEAQETLDGQKIKLFQFKDYPEKQKIRKEIVQKLDNNMYRSIITPREEPNLRKFRESLNRMNETNRDSMEGQVKRLEKFGRKTLETISIFPSLLTVIYTVIHTKPGDKVFDPFAGHNERAEDVVDLKRKYFGYDIYQYPVDFIKKALAKYDDIKEGEDFIIEKKSSEKIEYPDEFFDFIFSCPPYLDVEKYDRLYNEPKIQGDLSIGDVIEFDKLMEKVLKECFRVIKRGKFLIFIMGDIFRNGRTIPLHIHTINSATRAGFVLYDINIYNRKSNIGGDINYSHFIRDLKKLPTIHEYILIFKKE